MQRDYMMMYRFLLKHKHVISPHIAFTMQVMWPNQKTMKPKYLTLAKVDTVDI